MDKDKIPAYELVKEEDISDVRSHGVLLRHKKSGARVMLVENDDDNKVFYIGFRTPPKDSTGVAHILEHSVLCGSEKFPLKDPFVELAKGSLNTFLNAMTYSDKTVYPVASCNSQDFQNLMHVYLDAVFFPNIYKHEEIFRQEGWNYQLNDPDDAITYNGVVYNEMKGVFSSADEVLDREILNSLFPDTPYGVESGGDPKVIPELTYEQFLDFHRQYYHPSNSYIYLYGDMDMAEKLDFIDKEYLSRFDQITVDSQIPWQKPFEKAKDLERYYPILDNEDEEDGTYLSYNMVIGSSLDISLCMSFLILDYALLNSPGAPLKKALLDAGIGKDIYGSFDDGICQPYFSIVAKNARESDKERFIQVIRDTLSDLAKNGLDKKSLEAGINYFEFRFREADFSSYPKGLMYGLEAFSSWLYDDDEPFAEFKQLAIYQEMKANVHTDHFEGLIQNYMLDNTHATSLTLKPKKGLAAANDREVEEKLAALKARMSETEICEMAAKTKALQDYQEQEETPEAIASIPLLRRSDIKREASKLYNKEYFIDDTLFLHHDVDTNGIGYLAVLFDLKEIPQELIPYVGLLKSVLGYVDTKNYTYGELFNEINVNTGGIHCGTEVHDRLIEEDGYVAFFGIKSKALYPKMEFVFQMMEEILTTSNLDDTKRLYEIIARLKSRLQTGLPSAGHSTAVQRAISYFSPMGWFQEQTGGVAFYKFMEGLEQDFEACKGELTEKLKELMHLIFRPENLKISFTGEEAEREKVMALTERFKGILDTISIPASSGEGKNPWHNEAFCTAGQVQYVAQAGNFRKAGYGFTGAMSILKVILGYDYLWSQVRVKGGAYGCMSGFRRNGEAFFVSYRDPHLRETLDVYRGIPAYLRDFQADERAMTKYIIGAISSKDVPLTPQMKGNISTSAYFMGVTEEMMQRERDQILDAAPEDIRALAEPLEAVLSQGHICVIGGEEMIGKEKDLFADIKYLTEGKK